MFEAVIIGSGFGGSITACRLSKKWPNGKVLVLERGKRYPMYSFARTPHEMGKNFWSIPSEQSGRKKTDEETHGLFDIRNFHKMDAVVSAGLGGGSLIYANVFLEPPEWVFGDRWAFTIKKKNLEPYYKIVKEVLGARPIPNPVGKRRIVRTERFKEVADTLGHKSKLLDINVFFGNDFENPLPIGQQEKNKYGALQTSCTYCGECDVGCNTHSKNTLDLNYLFVAETIHKAEIKTEHLVKKIIPLSKDLKEEVNSSGEFGYRVYYLDLNLDAKQNREFFVDTKRVILSAGTLGTTELLLKCKEVYKTLPRISEKLGHYFSGNGDFLSFVIDGEKESNPNYGPVITQGIDFNLFENPKKEEAFILEDASYPVFASWAANVIRKNPLKVFWHTIKDVFLKLIKSGSVNGQAGFLVEDILQNDISQNSSVLLFMGVDNSLGKMLLKSGELNIDWSQEKSMPLYKKILDVTKKFAKIVKAKTSFPLFNWNFLFKENITVHALGGAILAESIEQGVTSANLENFGEVFNYKNLYCADGSIIPNAVGANPIATISALSEMVAEGITKIKPDSKLI